MTKIRRKQATLNEKISAVAETKHITIKEVAFKYKRSESCIKRWIKESKNKKLEYGKGSGRPQKDPKLDYKKNLYDDGFLDSLNPEQKDEILHVLHTFFLKKKSR